MELSNNLGVTLLSTGPLFGENRQQPPTKPVGNKDDSDNDDNDKETTRHQGLGWCQGPPVVLNLFFGRVPL